MEKCDNDNAIKYHPSQELKNDKQNIDQGNNDEQNNQKDKLYKNSQNNNENNKNIGNKLQNFKLLNELGRGSYGVIYKVRSLLDNKIYVLKKIDLSLLKVKYRNLAMKEVNILQLVRHKNIIQYITSFIESNCIYIIMEYADGGDLYKVYYLNTIILQLNQQVYQKTERFGIFCIKYAVLLIICTLITQFIEILNLKIYSQLRIFKSKYFLSSLKLSIKKQIGDLGVSKIVSKIDALQSTKVGTPLYLCPELVKQNPYDFKADIWAIGCVLYYMCSLELPFQGDNIIQLGYNIVHKQPKPIPNNFSKKLEILIQNMLEKQSIMRPSSKEIIHRISKYLETDNKNFKYSNIAIKQNEENYMKCNENQNNEIQKLFPQKKNIKKNQEKNFDQKNKITLQNKDIFDKKFIIQDEDIGNTNGLEKQNLHKKLEENQKINKIKRPQTANHNKKQIELQNLQLVNKLIQVEQQNQFENLQISYQQQKNEEIEINNNDIQIDNLEIKNESQNFQKQNRSIKSTEQIENQLMIQENIKQEQKFQQKEQQQKIKLKVDDEEQNVQEQAEQIQIKDKIAKMRPFSANFNYKQPKISNLLLMNKNLDKMLKYNNPPLTTSNNQLSHRIIFFKKNLNIKNIISINNSNPIEKFCSLRPQTAKNIINTSKKEEHQCKNLLQQLVNKNQPYNLKLQNNQQVINEHNVYQLNNQFEHKFVNKYGNLIENNLNSNAFFKSVISPFNLKNINQMKKSISFQSQSQIFTMNTQQNMTVNKQQKYSKIEKKGLTGLNFFSKQQSNEQKYTANNNDKEIFCRKWTLKDLQY